jgi:pre-mRNA-processing factor SLU7
MYAGENFVRYTGEVSHIAERQMFAWDASGKGVDVHLQADPTKAELLHKNFEAKKEQFQETQKQSILEKVSTTAPLHPHVSMFVSGDTVWLMPRVS